MMKHKNFILGTTVILFVAAAISSSIFLADKYYDLPILECDHENNAFPPLGFFLDCKISNKIPGVRRKTALYSDNFEDLEKAAPDEDDIQTCKNKFENVALTDRVFTDDEILEWADEHAYNLMNFNHENYKEQLLNKSRYYTDEGWDSAMKALKQSRTLDMMEALRLSFFTNKMDNISIQANSIAGESYQWIIQVPVEVAYTQGSRTRSDAFSLTIVIKRSVCEENTDGIGIRQWIATPR